MLAFIVKAQQPVPETEKEQRKTQQDSLRKKTFIQHLANGFFPTKYVDFDLRYLVKYNQYEGLRTGLGGQTSKEFSERYRLNSYVVYGLRDHRFKYSIGGGARLWEPTETWVNVSYTDDLQESGSTKFLTDKRVFQFFEPRLLNIETFHKHITRSLSIQHNLYPKVGGELQFSVSDIEPTYDYIFNLNGRDYTNYNLSSVTLALLWSPFDNFETIDGTLTKTKEGYPKFSFQYLRSVKGIFKSDFNFDKFDFKTFQRFNIFPKSKTEFTLTAGISAGEVPLTHLYHAYPNNITKETILQRFSVASNNGFETMYFGEFFSDRFATLQMKHYFKPFKLTERWQPQLALVSRVAFGTIRNKERHQNINFNILDKGYTESGIELNKLLFGFGLSLNYRYGAYHLPRFEDNFALKFTFNITL